MSMGRWRIANTQLFLRTSTALRHTSRPRSRACPRSARSGSRRSITARLPICRRFTDRRPGAGGKKLLAQRGPFVRRHRRRRRWLAARRMDCRRRAKASTCLVSIHGASALTRSVGHPRREERGGLRQGLHYPLSRRGARRRAPSARDALLRGRMRRSRPRVWLRLRLGAAELVRAARLRPKRGGSRET